MSALKQPFYVIGDVHGQLAKLARLLQSAGLIDPDALWIGGPVWAGGAAQLWFLGDFVDRGPASLGVLDLVMRLQREAPEVGGLVGGLLGNHEVQLLAAARFGDQPLDAGSSFREAWQRDGGVSADLASLTPVHQAWLRALPALARVSDALLVHADALFYTQYGASLPAVNAAIAGLLAGDDAAAWARLLQQFAGRRAFLADRADGTAQAVAFLARFGGGVLVHGHTPIPAITDQAPTDVTGPLVYAGGLCVNCDGGMAQGGPGFIYRLPA